MFSNEMLPVIFMFLMGLSVLIYVILDGYDLGVGILMPKVNHQQKDLMLSSIGPFWDANETWLVLGIGLLLTAFPKAHGIILTQLYLPVALMLIGLILRGVAFDFRVKAADHHRDAWNWAFFGGSLLATLAQGFMLGFYIMGFESSFKSYLFSSLIALALVAGYGLLGACWLMIKTEGALQRFAAEAAYWLLWLTGAGIALVSVATPLASPAIFSKWFNPQNFIWLSPIPLLTGLLFFIAVQHLIHFRQQPSERRIWLPFVASAGIFMLAFIGLAYSLFPYLVADRLTIWQAASAPESLRFILVGAVVVLPAILLYSLYSYRVFWGKTRQLSYQ